jgi:hypothetical protein
VCLTLQEFISRVNDVDNLLADLEAQYETLKTDGYVTATDGLKAQVIKKFYLVSKKHDILSCYQLYRLNW